VSAKRRRVAALVAVLTALVVLLGVELLSTRVTALKLDRDATVYLREKRDVKTAANVRIVVCDKKHVVSDSTIDDEYMVVDTNEICRTTDGRYALGAPHFTRWTLQSDGSATCYGGDCPEEQASKEDFAPMSSACAHTALKLGGREPVSLGARFSMLFAPCG
jgi:hypothetical protein